MTIARRGCRKLPSKAAVAALIGLLATGCGDDRASLSQPAAPAADAPVVLVGRCLSERGYDVEVDELANAVEFHGTATQMQSYDTDYTDCDKQFGKKVVPFSKFTDAMWRDLYQQETDTADCLRGEGIDVPQIPSFETFVQRYQGTDPWTSYRFVPTMSETASRELNETCSQPDL